MNILKRHERDFLVCGDCAYFQEDEIIDKRFPEIKSGKCIKHHILVDNLKEVNCADNTDGCTCDMCKFFNENMWFEAEEEMNEDNYPYECTYKNIPVEEDSRPCEHFKSFYN